MCAYVYVYVSQAEDAAQQEVTLLSNIVDELETRVSLRC